MARKPSVLLTPTHPQKSRKQIFQDTNKFHGTNSWSVQCHQKGLVPLSHTQWRATETEPQRKTVELWISKPRNLALKAAKAADSLAQAGARRQVGQMERLTQECP
eukprot:s673_g3.t1